MGNQQKISTQTLVLNEVTRALALLSKISTLSGLLQGVTFQGVKERREVVGGRGREDEGELSSNISGHLGPRNLIQHQLTHLDIIPVQYTHTRGMQHISWRAKLGAQYYFTHVLARIYNHDCIHYGVFTVTEEYYMERYAAFRRVGGLASLVN